MGKTFRPNNKESILLSKIESSKERERRSAINGARDNIDALSNSVAMKLIENSLLETNNKNAVEEQIYKKIEELCKAEDFDVDYQTAPFRHMVPNPNILYPSSTMCCVWNTIRFWQNWKSRIVRIRLYPINQPMH